MSNNCNTIVESSVLKIRYGLFKSYVLKEHLKVSFLGLPKEDRKISDKQPNSTSKGTRGTTTNKAQRKRRKEIIKARAELNDRDLKKKTTHNPKDQ